MSTILCTHVFDEELGQVLIVLQTLLQLTYEETDRKRRETDVTVPSENRRRRAACGG